MERKARPSIKKASPFSRYTRNPNSECYYTILFRGGKHACSLETLLKIRFFTLFPVYHLYKAFIAAQRISHPISFSFSFTHGRG